MKFGVLIDTITTQEGRTQKNYEYLRFIDSYKMMNSSLEILPDTHFDIMKAMFPSVFKPIKLQATFNRLTANQFILPKKRAGCRKSIWKLISRIRRDGKGGVWWRAQRLRCWKTQRCNENRGQSETPIRNETLTNTRETATLLFRPHLWGRNYILKWGFFLFRQFWPTDIFIVKKCE